MVDVDDFPNHGGSGSQDRSVEWRPVDRGRVLLRGRLHSPRTTNGRKINVGGDVWNYRPVPEQRLIELERLAAGSSDAARRQASSDRGRRCEVLSGTNARVGVPLGASPARQQLRTAAASLRIHAAPSPHHLTGRS